MAYSQTVNFFIILMSTETILATILFIFIGFDNYRQFDNKLEFC